MSALGEKQIFAAQEDISVLSPIATAKADFLRKSHVCFAPKSGQMHCKTKCQLRATARPLSATNDAEWPMNLSAKSE